MRIVPCAALAALLACSATPPKPTGERRYYRVDVEDGSVEPVRVAMELASALGDYDQLTFDDEPYPCPCTEEPHPRSTCWTVRAGVVVDRGDYAMGKTDPVAIELQLDLSVCGLWTPVAHLETANVEREVAIAALPAMIPGLLKLEDY